MKTQTHTQGPWIKEGGTVCQSDTLQTICKTSGKDEATQSANARLIAAAPDMLDALQAIVDYMETAKFPSVDLMTEAFVQDSLLIDQCKAVLNKAIGKQ